MHCGVLKIHTRWNKAKIQQHNFLKSTLGHTSRVSEQTRKVVPWWLLMHKKSVVFCKKSLTRQSSKIRRRKVQISSVRLSISKKIQHSALPTAGSCRSTAQLWYYNTWVFYRERSTTSSTSTYQYKKSITYRRAIVIFVIEAALSFILLIVVVATSLFLYFLYLYN